MDALPQLTEDQIQKRAFGASFSRGYSYFESGAILNPRRADMTLRAQCWGSAPQPYHVQAILGAGGVLSAFCSCPVGAGGACKHVVALLLTWLHQPQHFKVVASLEESLNQRSKEELVKLILKLIERDPDLEPLVEMPLPGHGDDGPPIDAALIKRQVQRFIGNMSYEWGASYAAASEISHVVSEGDAYANAGDWRNAAIVYSTTAKEILDNYEDIYEEEGEFLYEVGRCAEGLAECLNHIENGKQRYEMIRTLFDMVRWDIDFGGVGLSDEAELALVEQTTSDERVEIAVWAREMLASYEKKADTYSSGWREQALGGFLLNLEMDTLDDEAYIVLCRETRRLRDLVGRLLELGRVSEAVAEARQASDYELLALSDDIRTAGYGDMAEQLLWKRCTQTKDTRVVQQLLTWVQERGDFNAALELALQVFQMRKHVEHYQQLRAVAQSAERWPEIQTQVLDQLSAENQHALLIEIYLAETRIDDALKELRTLEQSRRSETLSFHMPSSLSLKVARAAEAERPEAAIEIYVNEARHLIARRGRGNYNEAARHLVRVKNILQELDKQKQWNAFITQIREDNRRLPALKDELNRAGL